MQINALSVVDYIVDARADWGITDALRPVIAHRVGLTAAEWNARLAADGFTDADTARLDDLIAARLTPNNLARLSQLLRDVQDPDDTDKPEPTAREWLGHNAFNLGGLIYDAGFPNQIDAICYAACAVGRAFSSTVAIESMRRRLATAPAFNWEMAPADVALGQAIADAGLAEDAKAWPAY